MQDSSALESCIESASFRPNTRVKRQHDCQNSLPPQQQRSSDLAGESELAVAPLRASEATPGHDLLQNPINIDTAHVLKRDMAS